MPGRVRVAHVDELPPGRGKVVVVSGRNVAIVNREGRLRATVEHARAAEHVGGLSPPGHAAPCAVGGGFFDAAAPGAPDESFEGPQLSIGIEGEDVFVWMDAPLAD